MLLIFGREAEYSKHCRDANQAGIYKMSSQDFTHLTTRGPGSMGVNVYSTLASIARTKKLPSGE